MRTLLSSVLLLAVAVAAVAGEQTIQYDDGVAEGELSNMLTGDIEAFRLTTEHPATLKTIQLQIDGGDGGGDVEFHLWAEFGGNNADLDAELIAPITQAISLGSAWYEFDVSAAAIEIAPWWNFHVGIVHLRDGLPGLLLDTSAPSPDIRTEYYSIADDTWYYVGDSSGSYFYMARAVVDYHDQIEPAAKPFQDVSDAAGLPRSGARPAWGDYDNDGDPDLLLSGSLLYRNNGDGTFTDVTDAAGLTGLPGSGGVWADFDNDGWLDLYVATSAYQTAYNRLMHNNGDGTFADISLTAFGGEDLLNYEVTEGLGVGDYDLDGYVDVYAGAYERGDLGSCPFDKFFRNNGDLTLADASEAVGLKNELFQCARGVQWIDVNDDGWPDVHVSNYRLDPNFMWVSNGAGAFANQAEAMGLAGIDEGDHYYGHTIGSAWGDLDLDGYFDVVDANLAHPRFIDFSDKTMVLLSSGAPDYQFTDVREQVGVGYMETHSNPNLVDIDNDGDLDLFITGVYVGYKSQLYLNKLVEEGELRFELYNYPSGVRVDNGWGSAWADYDGDGDLDLYATGLWRNDLGANGNNWIKIKCVGQKANAAAIGARISVRVGDVTYLREVQAGSGTTTQDDLTQHVGLGAATTVDELVVKFPGASTVTLTEVEPNQTITVTDTATSDDDSDDDASPDDDANDDDDNGQSPGDDDDDNDSGCGC